MPGQAVRFIDPSGAERIGRLDGEAVTDAGAAGPEGFVPTAEAWNELESADGPSYSVDELRLLAPVSPRKIICIGLNYRDHAEESQLDIPEVPVVFAKWPTAVIGPGDEIVIPREETRPDYEAELALVIGRRVKRATGADARSAIGGITAFHDVSGRRGQLETPLRQFTWGKSFDTFAPMGPAITRADGLDLGNIGVRGIVSGETMQDSNTSNLIFSAEELVAYCSMGTTLEPGDVIATGTPGGVGDSRNPKRYLREGDTVEIWVEHVGSLVNPVVQER
jgi:2-keto-4-pentenoate hydratase/2-oxohepta-3-ene-1,7-dioic acid hydratase in catechol pathway